MQQKWADPKRNSATAWSDARSGPSPLQTEIPAYPFEFSGSAMAREKIGPEHSKHDSPSF